MGFWRDIRRDYKAVFERDPAVRNGLEVILAYPGFHAIFIHRINHISLELAHPGFAEADIPYWKIYYRHRDPPGCQDRPGVFY